MIHRFFLFMPVFVALTLINPITAFTIKPQDFIVSIYGENKWLPEECNEYIVNILTRYENEQGTITVNNKTRKAIWGHTFRTMQKYHHSSFEYKAALVIQRMIKKLHAEQKNAILECPICIDDPGNQKIELACSHIFCQPCLLTWYTQNESTEQGGHTSCPTCRLTILPRIQNSFQKMPAYKNMLKENLSKRELAEAERHQLEQLQAYQDDMNAWDEGDFNPFGRVFNHFRREYEDDYDDDEFNLNIGVNVNAIGNHRPADSDSSSDNSDSEGSKDYPSSSHSDSDSSDSDSSSSESSSESSDSDSSSSDESTDSSSSDDSSDESSDSSSLEVTL